MNETIILQKKICLVGDFAVGKTSLIKKFVHSQFDETYLTTIGVHVTKKDVPLDNAVVRLLIWDLAGDDGFQKIKKSYLQGASGVIIVGDITRTETISSIKKHFNDVFSQNINCSSIVVFNKMDLQQEVNFKEIPDSLKELNIPDSIPLYRTSAKTGDQVELIFHSISKLIYENFLNGK